MERSKRRAGPLNLLRRTHVVKRVFLGAQGIVDTREW